MHQSPKLNNQPYRLAIISDRPSKDDEANHKVLSGMYGKLVWGVAAREGIVESACFVGYCSDPELPELLDGFKPNLVFLLGDEALKAAKNNTVYADLSDDEVDAVSDDDDEPKVELRKTPIDKWRGSLFMGYNGKFKCLATYHPREVFRFYGECIYPFNLDFKKARREAGSSMLDLPARELTVEAPPEITLGKLQHLLATKRPVACDIEGYIDTMSCISFATSPADAFIVPTAGNYWGALEPQMWRLLAQVLEDPHIPKILQNCLYDMFVLQWSYNICVRGVSDDTMLKHWELLCELPKSLGFQASVYTREPYYKSERMSEDRLEFFRYCCKDSAITHEINSVLDVQLKGPARTHYQFNLALIDPILFIELNGMKYDLALADSKLQKIEAQTSRLQYALDQIAGYDYQKTKEEWLALCVENFCYKKEAFLVQTVNDILDHCKPSELGSAQKAVHALSQPTLSIGDYAELASLNGLGLNVKSTPQLCSFLYDQLQLPTQYKKEKGRLTTSPTTDALALLKLYSKTGDPALKLILSIRALRTRCNNLKATADADGRIRCGLNIVGTETGRLSCYKSPTGSGFNLQTATKKDRDLFCADQCYWFFQCDLSGADGWTVAAHCKAVGDPTMMEDYLYGIKPANCIVLMRHFGRQVNSWPREKIKAESKFIDKDGWEYFSGKQTQHGGSYLMKENTMADTIIKISYKLFGDPMFVPPAECRENLGHFFDRYRGIPIWHQRRKAALMSTGTLTSANGHTRRFFGRRDDMDTLKQSLAEEPQNNTTYVTNLAMLNQWTDPENRLGGLVLKNAGDTLRATKRGEAGGLIVIPAHQVHDALIGQFPMDHTDWAKKKIHQWFNNPITIAGQTLVIPFEGEYGYNWGMHHRDCAGGSKCSCNQKERKI